MTTSEYFQTPETVLPRELAFGVLHVAEAPTAAHQRVVRDLTILLTLYAREQGLGEVLPSPIDVVLDYDAALVVQPDIVFVARERAHIVGERIDGAPELAIEVLSPRARVGDLNVRLGWFAKYGVRECWIIDLAHRRVASVALERDGVARHHLVAPNQSIPSRVLPDLPIRPLDFLHYLA